MCSVPVANEILLQVAVQDIGQLTDFERWPTSPSRARRRPNVQCSLTARPKRWLDSRAAAGKTLKPSPEAASCCRAADGHVDSGADGINQRRRWRPLAGPVQDASPFRTDDDSGQDQGF